MVCGLEDKEKVAFCVEKLAWTDSINFSLIGMTWEIKKTIKKNKTRRQLEGVFTQ